MTRKPLSSTRRRAGAFPENDESNFFSTPLVLNLLEVRINNILFFLTFRLRCLTLLIC